MPIEYLLAKHVEESLSLRGGSVLGDHGDVSLHPRMKRAIILVNATLSERMTPSLSRTKVSRIEQSARTTGNSVHGCVLVHPSHCLSCFHCKVSRTVGNVTRSRRSSRNSDISAI